MQLFSAKNPTKNTKCSTNETLFKIGHHAKAYSPCKILTLGQKLKFQKTRQNPFYKSSTVVLCKKPLQKTPNIREMRPCWKSAIMQSLYPMQNPHFGSKIKILKNLSKSILQIIYSCSLQKPGPKNTKYSTNETIFKIGHHAKAYSQKFKFQKTCQNPFYKSSRVVLCKKPLQKTPNIRKMRPCWKSAIMQRL